MTGRTHTIRGRRKNLLGVQKPSDIGFLDLKGDVESLEGIERMTSLRGLWLERHRDPELDRLAGVQGSLEVLSIFTDADADFSLLSQFHKLEQLQVRTPSQRGAQSLAAVDFSALDSLRSVTLVVDEKWHIPIDTSWVSAQLIAVTLCGFALDEANVDQIAAPVNERNVRLLPLSSALERRLERASGSMSADVPTPVVGQILEFSGWFSVALALSEKWELESEYDASDHLRHIVEAADATLCPRLEWDPTADMIWVRANAREDLEAVLAIVAMASAPAG